ncbi:Glyceraldehyde-3-phosphate dehydrogenase, chloroplastic [Porphyridium purpureum]|uniref:Glyceraldehyde-3-phosphate dehydrogenase n=1 Tax=Porphyridium purpureum TaxID=35688 RepID=A0A5J4YV84_PORPP|nr:Glyceraldehyde-3-phosphate dehydrogenase, chloroplastic [Porphyridium purpureum]|eukprot:POR0070..scf209_3
MAFVSSFSTVSSAAATRPQNVCAQRSFVGAPVGRVSTVSPVVAKASASRAAGSAGDLTMKVRVAINGFGRIGRNVLRCWEGRADSPLEIVAINDTSGVKTAAHLLKYDSILGTFDADVKVVDDNTISVNGKNIAVVSSRNPLELPWKEMNIDIVVEGTGVFVDGPGAGKHLQAGAKKVVITAPGKGPEVQTIVVGVNHETLDCSKFDIISNASCTTNCMAPFVKVLEEEFGIVKGCMTTTHSYTGDQRLLDAGHRDLRRARAAALNIVPTTTGAAQAVALVVPSVKGKLNGIALRVPTPNVSIVDFVCNVEKKTFKEEVNGALLKASQGSMKGILKYSDEPLVSADIKGENCSSVIDSSLSMVIGDDLVKVVAWYDNEWGYSQRCVDLCDLVAKQMQ